MFQLTHGKQGFLGLFGFFFINNAHRETNVDENPFAKQRSGVVATDKGNIHLTLHAANIHGGKL